MSQLSEREKELIAIGAAVGSNCVPCIEYHIPVAKKLGLEEGELKEAIDLAHKVKNVPAKKLYDVANQLITEGDPGGASDGACCN